MQTGKSLNLIDQLLKDGLCPNIQQINWYRQVLVNPQDSFNNTIYRNIAGEVFDKLLSYVLNDSVLFNRLRQDLLADSFDRRAFESLQRKAVENDVHLDVLVEVYRRGFEQNEPHHMTREQRAFSRVNSFVSKGRAWYEDFDLVGDKQVNTLKEDLPRDKKTVSTIRRIKKNVKE